MVRQGKISDLNRIMKIEKDVFNKGIIEKSTVYLERINVFPQGFLVSEKKKILQGFFTTEIWDKKNLKANNFILGHSIRDSHNEMGSILYISSFAISKKFQGRGTGKKLFDLFLNKILEDFENIEEVVLIVSSRWKKAQKIYKNYGFQKEFLVDNFFNLNEDGIVMKKKLGG